MSEANETTDRDTIYIGVDVGVERWHTSKNVRAGSNDKGEHTMKPCTENGRVSTRWDGKKMIVC